jgi:hypothetical protein
MRKKKQINIGSFVKKIIEKNVFRNTEIEKVVVFERKYLDIPPNPQLWNILKTVHVKVYLRVCM